LLISHVGSDLDGFEMFTDDSVILKRQNKHVVYVLK